ncbi:phage protein Gp13 family protein [Pseudomonas sp. B14(2017)]|uniref:phage protein Gp13 family protein n=1 Tax=Pseudomonas sp. B14(2017) TaxID=1981745 RepID=UPI000A1FDC98|nr:phage protein Gp13 family protein [Pseudomonas sp. B14(2017)]
MRLHKANYGHLYQAAINLAPSDRAEMDRVKPGRCPVRVLTASSSEPSIKAITDDRGNVLAVGGTPGDCIWFVHTTHADALSPRDKMRMFFMLRDYLRVVQGEGVTRTNIVSLENTKHIKLLNALGCTWGNYKRAFCDDTRFRQFFL